MNKSLHPHHQPYCNLSDFFITSYSGEDEKLRSNLIKMDKKLSFIAFFMKMSLEKVVIKNKSYP